MDRKTANYLICPGEACPFRFACQRWQNWMNNEDDGADEMAPDYHDGKCAFYVIKDYFYGG